MHVCDVAISNLEFYDRSCATFNRSLDRLEGLALLLQRLERTDPPHQTNRHHRLRRRQGLIRQSAPKSQFERLASTDTNDLFDFMS